MVSNVHCMMDHACNFVYKSGKYMHIFKHNYLDSYFSTVHGTGVALRVLAPYLVHLELVHMYKNLNNFRQERGMGTGLVPFYSTC